MGTLLWVNLLRLVRDPAALALTFLLPPVFFSVFALVFSRLDGAEMQYGSVQFECSADAAWCDRLSAGLEERVGVRMQAPLPGLAPGEAVQSGHVAAALKAEADGRIRIWTDPSDPVTARALPGRIQAASAAIALSAMQPSLGPDAGRSPAQPVLPAPAGATAGVLAEAIPELPAVIVEQANGAQPSVAFFAAGIGVMFALLSASGRAAMVIGERENGIAERLGASGVSDRMLLFSRWLFLTAICSAQLVVMFLWASIAFDLEVFAPGVPGALGVLILATAMAAAAFGLVIACWSTSRAQLTALATGLVLPMSALAGSLLPRALLPDAVNAVGALLFNAWALDGFRKILWQGRGIEELGAELLVLAASTLAGLALCLARRGTP